jgi:hypothetical protein
MGVFKFAAIYIGTIVVSLPLMIYGSVVAAEWYLKTRVESPPDSSADIAPLLVVPARQGTTVVTPAPKPSATPAPKPSATPKKRKTRAQKRAEDKFWDRDNITIGAYGHNGPGCYKGICELSDLPPGETLDSY